MTPEASVLQQEDVGVAAQADHALLDARAAAVVQTDHRRAVFHGQFHDLDDLLGVRLGERAAEDREVLRKDVDRPAVDGAVAGHHAVAHEPLLFQAEIVAAVRDEHVELAEAAFVEHEVQPLARRQLAGRVLAGDSVLAAAAQRLLLSVTQLFDLWIGRQWCLLGSAAGVAGCRLEQVNDAQQRECHNHDRLVDQVDQQRVLAHDAQKAHQPVVGQVGQPEAALRRRDKTCCPGRCRSARGQTRGSAAHSPRRARRRRQPLQPGDVQPLRVDDRRQRDDHDAQHEVEPAETQQRIADDDRRADRAAECRSARRRPVPAPDR